MTADQAGRAARFRALHDQPRAFLMPNPWDAGSTRILAGMGFAALATTSAGAAFALGRRDGRIGRDAALANARAIVAATDLPVSADLENGYADTPQGAAETVRLAIEAGLAGCSIEDASGDPRHPIYAFDLAVERVAACAEAARRAGLPFMLTARAENFLHGVTDLEDTLRRLQAFERAGADVLYAPALPDEAAIRMVCATLSRPVNVLAASMKPSLPVAVLDSLGVRRISLGAHLSRAAFGALTRAAREMLEHGTFGFADDAMPFGEASRFMSE